MTTQQLDEVDRLDKAATKGPWDCAAESGEAFIFSDNAGMDADIIPGLADVSLYQPETEEGLNNHALIAYYRTAAPKLAAEVRRLTKLIEEAPHEIDCAIYDNLCGGNPCDCWKSRLSEGEKE